MRRPLDGVCVLFDLDGTFVDTADDLAAAMNHALQSAGVAPVPAARVRGLIGHGARAMLAKGLAENGVANPAPAYLDGLMTTFLRYYEAHIADCSTVFPGAVEAADDLRRDGARIVICTNKRERLARRLIAALNLESRFDLIVGPDTAGAAKPDPRPVHWCLEKTNANSGVFIGDSDTDILAAEAASLPCLINEGGYGPLDEREKAFALLSDYAELAAHVRRAAKR
ncbi:MAG: HAD-IA family hydrolase [Parvularculaceae bacterium]|nr:HAD-IA family hydrolase [Parvularculaceae bacterium]